MWPNEFVSRAALGWRGTNLIAGLVVVPPKKRFSVFYNIRGWPLEAGRTRAAIRMPVYDCAEFFASQAPKEIEVNSRFEFDARPSVRRN